LLNLVSSWWPSIQSKIFDRGYPSIIHKYINPLVRGAKNDAMAIWCGPTHAAWGIISPKNRTAVTEMMIAMYEGTNESKNIGSASRQQALEINKVTKSKCLWLITEITRLA